MEIATADGSISVAKLAIGSGKKPAEEAAHEAGIVVGDSLVR
jgi:hypothetical protein